MAYRLMVIRRNRGGLAFAEPVGDTPADALRALRNRLRRFKQNGFTITRQDNRWHAVNKQRVRVEVYVVDGSFEEVAGDPPTAGNGNGQTAQDAWTHFWEAYKQTGFKPTDKAGLEMVLGVTTTYGQNPAEMMAKLKAHLDAKKAEA